MAEKYKVSQELMNDISGWKVRLEGSVIGQGLTSEGLVIGQDLTAGDELPHNVYEWWLTGEQDVSEKNNRLIALIRYANGEDVFEVEKPKKWIVRSKYSADKYHYYVSLKNYDRVWDSAPDVGHARFASLTYNIDWAFKFNTKEEAEQFTNPLMEVVEV